MSLALVAKETGLCADDVPESELWDISFFEEFNIRLENNGGKADVIRMSEYLKNKECGEKG